MSPESQKAVDEVVKTIMAEDPTLRRWVEQCRNTFGPKINCERDVFGDCDKCDGIRRRKTALSKESSPETATLGGGLPGDPSGELTALCKGLVAAVAFGDNREVSAMFDTPELAHAFVRYLQRFMPPKGSKESSITDKTPRSLSGIENKTEGAVECVVNADEHCDCGKHGDAAYCDGACEVPAGVGPVGAPSCTYPNCKGGQCCMNPSNARSARVAVAGETVDAPSHTEALRTLVSALREGGNASRIGLAATVALQDAEHALGVGVPLGQANHLGGTDA